MASGTSYSPSTLGGSWRWRSRCLAAVTTSASSKSRRRCARRPQWSALRRRATATLIEPLAEADRPPPPLPPSGDPRRDRLRLATPPDQEWILTALIAAPLDEPDPDVIYEGPGSKGGEGGAFLGADLKSELDDAAPQYDLTANQQPGCFFKYWWIISSTELFSRFERRERWRKPAAPFHDGVRWVSSGPENAVRSDPDQFKSALVRHEPRAKRVGGVER